MIKNKFSRTALCRRAKIYSAIGIFLTVCLLSGCAAGEAEQNPPAAENAAETEAAIAEIITENAAESAQEPEAASETVTETAENTDSPGDTGILKGDNTNVNRRVYIENNEFLVDGKKIWINGANTPWNKWNDFGGGYNAGWWDNHFAQLHEAGVNATRVWINCNNDQKAVEIDENGFVTGVSDKHFQHLDSFFETAEKHHIYIMATLLSFDHFKDTGTRPAALKWRNMLTNGEAAASFAENYTIPFLKRYGDNPWLWSIDLCNEPDWVYENPECGNIAWEHISYFCAVNAAAIHENSDALVTVGLSFPKYNADGPSCEGNKFSDAYLQALYENENAYLDFWSTHYYDWVGPWYGIPYYIGPYGRHPNGYGLESSKPAVIGECPAKGSANKTLIQDYASALKTGWQGVMPWTSNGVDGNGGFKELEPAARYMLEKHGDLVFPWGD